ncbi:hypothetical protein AGMMS50239_37780 [Bacteroidia bacterium]|nr:hypothetical protein AGMMS50239_37780 [Bacteroidia bacterium]
MSNQPNIKSSAAEYLTFVASKGENYQNIEIRYENETIWLTQKMLAALYDVEVHTINYHIKKIFEDRELSDTATIRNFRIVQMEGNRQVARDVEHYDLQMIIAIGFKVNSGRTVQLDQILLANKYELLQNAGRISMEIARQHAETEFEKYRIEQDQLYESDFDRFLLLEESVKQIEN